MIDTLIEILCREKGELPQKNLNQQQKDHYFRSLCNIRLPMPLSDEFLELQDQYLAGKSLKRGIIDVTALEYKDSIALWQGDITRINSNAIVNACKSSLLGCFHPLHNCIDNIIHSNAGVQVRRDCHTIMQGEQLPAGEVIMTPAYNLPGKFIFHTVGPIIQNGIPTEQQAAKLSKCYRSCLKKASALGIQTLTFCCLSTGVYGYPKNLAAALAVATVKEWLPEIDGLKVIFNVFEDEDKTHYERELSR